MTLDEQQLLADAEQRQGVTLAYEALELVVVDRAMAAYWASANDAERVVIERYAERVAAVEASGDPAAADA